MFGANVGRKLEFVLVSTQMNFERVEALEIMVKEQQLTISQLKCELSGVQHSEEHLRKIAVERHEKIHNLEEQLRPEAAEPEAFSCAEETEREAPEKSRKAKKNKKKKNKRAKKRHC